MIDASYFDTLFGLHGKVAIVTGAARGNGAEIAHALREAGATVYTCDVLEVFSENHWVFDITDSTTLRAFVDYIQDQEERLDILVNNAGITLAGDSDKSFDETYNINLKPCLRLMRWCSEYMKETGGSIINITSLNSELAFNNNPAYMAMKGALKQLSKSFALDYGKYGIRVNNIGPGYIKTDMTKKSWDDKEKRKARADRTMLGRWGTPEDLCGLAIFLASDASSYITAQDIYVDGGWLFKGE